MTDTDEGAALVLDEMLRVGDFEYDQCEYLKKKRKTRWMLIMMVTDGR